ncbi:uncharacterized protein LOC117178302 isoform X2 [Belonocnema kinseyi]|uniref:uncharacterized protein LOC117178302 isoform X2 n=1 Tax=Belonocnema kinseyi TaxID=2817044 RepID=UPI00143DF5EB|nr:uncharacterized protein LOC117178302 isoform X2 [Belonocnema kinseyi]
MELKPKRLCFTKRYVWEVTSEKKIDVQEHQATGNCWIKCATFITVSLMSMGTGAAELWMTPALPHLKSTNFKFSVSTEELSWIISLFNTATNSTWTTLLENLTLNKLIINLLQK